MKSHIHHEEGKSEGKFHEGLFSRNKHIDTDDDDFSNDVHEFPVRPLWLESLVEEDKVSFESNVLKPFSVNEHPKDSKKRKTKANHKHRNSKSSCPESVFPLPAFHFKIILQPRSLININTPQKAKRLLGQRGVQEEEHCDHNNNRVS